jgi:hypothetical protein
MARIYEATTGKPVAVILRAGKTPDGPQVALVLRHVMGHIRARWPAVEIIVRGDSHHRRPEAMTWCERQRVGYIFGLPGNPAPLRRLARSPRTPPSAASRAKGKRSAAMAISAMTQRVGRSSTASSSASRPIPPAPTAV